MNFGGQSNIKILRALRCPRDYVEGGAVVAGLQRSEKCDKRLDFMDSNMKKMHEL